MSLELSRQGGLRRGLRLILLCACLALGPAWAAGPAAADADAARYAARSVDGLWQRLPGSAMPWRDPGVARPRAYDSTRLDLARLQALLAPAPIEDTPWADARGGVEISLPLPGGRFGRFRVINSPILDPETASRFPEISTYRGRGIDDPGASVRLDLGPTGMNAYVRDLGGVAAIRPYAEGDRAHYQSYFLRDDPAEAAAASCNAAAEDPWHAPLDALGATGRVAPAAVQQSIRRTYRIAIGATQEYTAQNGGTVASALAAIVTRLQGVNLVFNAEIGVQLNLVTPALIGTTEPDGYTSGNTNSLIAENQAITDLLIGPANYDLGHVFDAAAPGGGASGLARSASVCRNDEKASGTSGGNSIALLAHELGHMFGASHTFNNNAGGSCASFNGANQREPSTAMEPGSGSTLMSYAGTCGPADLQQSRDLYFHGQSLDQMVLYVSSGDGAACAAISNTGNGGITITDWTPTVTVPDRTPFRLSLRATDADFDPVTVAWDEVDAGAASPPELDNGDRALFRSYLPSQVQWRSFPRLDYVLNNASVPPGTYTCAAGPPAVTCLTGETLTTTTRTLKVRAHARDGFDALNSVQVAVNVVGGSGPFAVGSPNAPSDVWVQGTAQLVTWFPGASADPPIGVDTVRITLSTDGGLSFPIVLADAVPNSGIAPVYVPDDALSTQARVKVESVIPGNFHGFYDISNANFQIRGLAVTNLADSGEGSLRKAILDANSDPRLTTIRFAIGASGTLQVLTPQSPLPPITAPVEIDGWSQGGTGYEGPPLIELRGELIAAPNSDGLVITGGGSTIRGLSVHRFSGSGIVLRGGGGNVVEFSVIGANAGGSSTEGNVGNGIWIDNSPDNLIGRRTVAAAFRPNVIVNNTVGVLITGGGASGNGLYSNHIGTRGFGVPGYGNRSAGVRVLDAPGNLIGGHAPGGWRPGAQRRQRHFGPVLRRRHRRAHQRSARRRQRGALEPDRPHARRRHGVAQRLRRRAGAERAGHPHRRRRSRRRQRAGLQRLRGPCQRRGGHHDHDRRQHHRHQPGRQRQRGLFGVRRVHRGADPDRRRRSRCPQLDLGQWFHRRVPERSRRLGLAGAGQLHRHQRRRQRGRAQQQLRHLQPTGRQRSHRRLATGRGQPDLRQPGQWHRPGRRHLRHADRGQFHRHQRRGYGGDSQPGWRRRAHLRWQRQRGRRHRVGRAQPDLRQRPPRQRPRHPPRSLRQQQRQPHRGQLHRHRCHRPAAAGQRRLRHPGVLTGFLGRRRQQHHRRHHGRGAQRDRRQRRQRHLAGLRRPLPGRGQRHRRGADGSTPLGNLLDGVSIYGNRNQIGEAGAGNTIAYSGAGTVPASIAGVRIDNGEGNSVRGNSIHANNALGFNLLGGTENLGVTANDACDADSGPNRLQNFPVLLAVNALGASTTASGTLNAAPNQAFQIDLYASPDCDAAGHGEGRLHLGAFAATTGADCNASFSATLPVPLPPNQVATATATDAEGNTSEYSACTTVVGGELIFANGFE